MPATACIPVEAIQPHSAHTQVQCADGVPFEGIGRAALVTSCTSIPTIEMWTGLTRRTTATTAATRSAPLINGRHLWMALPP